MAHHRSAIKRAKQIEKRRIRNRFYRTRVKNTIKKVRQAIASNSLAEAEKALQQAVSIISRAASKGVLHWRNASRKISRLSKQVYLLKRTTQPNV
ncbi:MAG TPA: 30S ribosomal protein S20 [Candidatus Desulfofervidus auxilii]|uniref:Small ribosomal subunit protein bS20 n=1 Tax=Desulfofervidus auxilii TaxID=1621989 RepID=A0A7V0NEL2_DESA2|nr:30S ribosomal protein S20 [Candidatus Desulfofervidus auxilii]